ncbi:MULTISPECIES: hypothetical protein [Agrobacterium]|uniref:hypothetical protein n=1 Tax=Agrobacterium TaxID=357 RepID=UPI0009BBF247|nr:hypothetical protein [Agrobacterium tumefaciens]MDP9857592.1 hypothetical protein [Agrobacterium tumefaciens]CUX56631.1 conserved hypothetical protein [Agrobacterium tumefaciens str. CFBP 5621]
MDKKLEYQITAHENGWAVVISEAIRGVYPSRHLALAAAKLLDSDMLPAEETQRFATANYLAVTDAVAPSRFRTSPQPVVAVPYQVDVPLRRRRGEITFPSSIGGLNPAKGKA